MSRKKLAYVLAIIAVDALMFAGLVVVLLDVASHTAGRVPPQPPFSEVSFAGVFVFGAGLFGRIGLSLPTD